VRAPARARVGTLQWLYERYRETEAWTKLSPATRRQRENILGHVMEASGREPCTDIRKKHIEAGKDRRRETPAQARNFLDAMRGLFGWAVKAEYVTIDPSAGVDNPEREAGQGFKAWDESDVARYEARWPAGTRERVWLHVLRYVGCRRGDAVVLGRQHAKDGVLSFITEKGRKKKRITVTLRIEPELAATLAIGPCSNDLAFISNEYGKPYTKESFGNAFSKAAHAAGVKKSAHGLRKLFASTWAERGATEHELMAMAGWMTPQMAALYTREASRARMSLNAHDRLMGTPEQHSIPAPDQKVREAGIK
jgi:integrase